MISIPLSTLKQDAEAKGLDLNWKLIEEDMTSLFSLDLLRELYHLIYNMTEDEIKNADLTDHSILRRLVIVSMTEPDDVIRALARVTLEGHAIKIISDLLEVIN